MGWHKKKHLISINISHVQDNRKKNEKLNICQQTDINFLFFKSSDLERENIDTEKNCGLVAIRVNQVYKTYGVGTHERFCTEIINFAERFLTL